MIVITYVFTAGAVQQLSKCVGGGVGVSQRLTNAYRREGGKTNADVGASSKITGFCFLINNGGKTPMFCKIIGETPNKILKIKGYP